MSYSIDANLLLYASNRGCAEHAAASEFLEKRAEDPDLLCLTWSVLMAYQRIATHPAIFEHPLDPEVAWRNIEALLALPRTRVLGEEEGFGRAYRETSASLPDAARERRRPAQPSPGTLD
jgi:predicted nucleic acid-binding protein